MMTLVVDRSEACDSGPILFPLAAGAIFM